MSSRSRSPLIFVLLTVLIDTIGFGVILPVLPQLIIEVSALPLADATRIGVTGRERQRRVGMPLRFLEVARLERLRRLADGGRNSGVIDDGGARGGGRLGGCLQGRASCRPDRQRCDGQQNGSRGDPDRPSRRDTIARLLP